MPWVTRLYEELQQRLNKEQEYFIVDIEDKNVILLKELPALLDKDSMCVICSRAHLVDYFEVISNQAECIYYPAFLVEVGGDRKKKGKIWISL